MPEADNLESDSNSENTIKRKHLVPAGKSGTLVTGFRIDNDHISDLKGTEGQEQFFKMLLSDSQIRKLFHAVSNPIKSAQWDVEPASDDAKDIEIADLIRHILFNDLPDGFQAKLDEILTFPWHGHAVFEVIHENKQNKEFGNYTGLSNLAFRDQRTLDEWHFDKAGKLTKVHQIQFGDIQVNEYMPANTLLIFYNEKKGSDNGYPFCRMLYGNYKRKLLYKQLQAIGIERSALPVPHLKVPQSVDHESTEYTVAESQLAAFTQAEQAYFITPEGYELKLDSSQGFDPSKVQAAIKAENEEIAGSLIAMWLEMGIGGNSAVGSSTFESLEFFKAGIEYLAQKISEPINIKLIPNLVHNNFGDGVIKMPRLKHSGISDAKGKELMEVVTGYVKQGVMTNDEALEDFVREANSFPKKMEKENEDDEATRPNGNNPTPSNNNPDNNDELELAEDGKAKTPKQLIRKQQTRIADEIRKAINFSSQKYINDVMAKYRQLPPSKKQNATNNVKVGGINRLKRDLKASLTETVNLAIEMARKEIPSASDVELSTTERELVRMVEKYGPYDDIKLNEFSSLPTFLQIMLTRQTELIAEDTLDEMEKKLDFTYASTQRSTQDEAIIKQRLEEAANDFETSNQVSTKGANVSALMVNEGRDAFFFNEEVVEEVHSFTFVNSDPKSDICQELAGTTFNTNDAASLRFTPPLHHNAVLSDTLIETKSGPKKIQDVENGELVLTHTGNYKEVYDVMSRFEDKHYFEIELENGKKISITGEHPVLTDRGWVRVDEMKLEDDVICVEDIENE